MKEFVFLDNLDALKQKQKIGLLNERWNVNVNNTVEVQLLLLYPSWQVAC